MTVGSDRKLKTSETLTAFMAKINLSDLPAMSSNVQELISLTHSSQSATYELAKVILKDYSLTNKVLQVVNSAYYALGQRISSISRAVTVLGFDAVQDLATAIALFEDFVKAGADKEEISKLLTRAFVSAIHTRDMAVNKGFKVMPEEAFICSLLRNLGKTITCIYAPDIYREFERRVSNGESEITVSEQLLGLSFQRLGEEIATFWNLSETIILSMAVNPPPPMSTMDSVGMVCSLADYSNSLVDGICKGADLEPLQAKYGVLLKTDIHQGIEAVERSLAAAEDISDALRFGLTRLKLRSRLESAREKARTPSGKKAPVQKVEEVNGLTELPIGEDKSVNDYIHDLTETLMGQFDLNEVYVQLIEALYRGIGVDRVILSIIEIHGKKALLVGRFGLGDIDARKVREFQHPLDNTSFAVPMALKSGKDMAIPGTKLQVFPEEWHSLVSDRNVYLFPILVNKKPIGLIYLDRRESRPKLDASRVKTVRLLRDFATMAVRKISKRRRS